MFPPPPNRQQRIGETFVAKAGREAAPTRREAAPTRAGISCDLDLSARFQQNMGIMVKESEEEEESDEEETYKPEFIVGVRRARGQVSRLLYRIKWHGFPHSDDCDGDISEPAGYLVANERKW